MLSGRGPYTVTVVSQSQNLSPFYFTEKECHIETTQCFQYLTGFLSTHASEKSISGAFFITISLIDDCPKEHMSQKRAELMRGLHEIHNCFTLNYVHDPSERKG